MTSTKNKQRLLVGLGTLTLAGVVAGLVAFTQGHHVLGTTSELPWGLLIATYIFVVVSSTGLCLVSSIGHVFGVELFVPLAKRATLLALITLLVGFAVIATELERPILLMQLVLTSPNPSSAIWWMGTLYGVYFVLIAAELYFLLRGQHHHARTAGLLSVIAAVAAHSNLGGVFGLIHGRPYWYGPFLPVYFIASALVSGSALLILMVYFTEREPNLPILRALGKLLLLFLGVLSFMTVWKIIGGIAGDHEHKAVVTWVMLTGPYFVSFWLFEVFLAFVVPMAILAGPWRDRPGWLATAAASTTAAMLIVRYNFVVAGQMLPPARGMSAGFLSYTPSIVEVTIVLGALAGAVTLFIAALGFLERPAMRVEIRAEGAAS